MHIAECTRCEKERAELIDLLKYNVTIDASKLYCCETPGCPNNAQERSHQAWLRQKQTGSRPDTGEQTNDSKRKELPPKVA